MTSKWGHAKSYRRDNAQRIGPLGRFLDGEPAQTYSL
jgi:hypothetical protein